LARGVPITDVSRWLGHNSIEVTHQIYGHLTPASWERARALLDDAYRPGRCRPPETRADTRPRNTPPSCPNCPAVETMQIFEGTNQIQRLVISRDLAKG
jgi:alkylation response protein AidB-like acyl-CoA dehydrogenase